MLNMLDILGTIAGNVLSLPGILGLALGMMTRNLLVAAILGGLVGVAEPFIFAGFDASKVETIDLVIAIAVGVVAGCIGRAIRVKGATV
ncbi:hypothetical protein CLV78_102354 [Aliiruegeria haliotis]|uniref:Uncharacterized protein n=1 Tax=Aliiruegeria haliotis TaxID=1280846 RepID=A0A2T0RVJ5_9RHOB|nr:hypothetical protein [Aliiruegeria haliotis]PRY25177.1 hypothetical protein CLV78_102354 [Aliiruegeria haliotis]